MNQLGGGSGNDYEQKMQRVVRDYLEQIEQLRNENEELQSKINYYYLILTFLVMTSLSGDQAVAHLTQQNEILKQERDLLKNKIEDLQSLLEEKNREVNELKKTTVTANATGNEAMENLARTNERLMQELTKMQEQMRKMESFNQSYMSGVDVSQRYGL